MESFILQIKSSNSWQLDKCCQLSWPEDDSKTEPRTCQLSTWKQTLFCQHSKTTKGIHTVEKSFNLNLVKYGDKSRSNCFVNQSGKTTYKRQKFEREPGLTGLEPWGMLSKLKCVKKKKKYFSQKDSFSGGVTTNNDNFPQLFCGVRPSKI